MLVKQFRSVRPFGLALVLGVPSVHRDPVPSEGVAARIAASPPRCTTSLEGCDCPCQDQRLSRWQAGRLSRERPRLPASDRPIGHATGTDRSTAYMLLVLPAQGPGAGYSLRESRGRDG